MSRSALSRRGFLSGAAGVTALGALSACGDSEPAVVGDQSSTDQSLTVSNWALYIDTDRKGPEQFPSVAAFEEETGIAVTYQEDITANDEFFAKIRPQLASGEGVDRDLIVMTDWMAARLIRLGYVNELDTECHPERREPAAVAGRPQLRPRAQVLDAVAVRLHVDRLQRLGRGRTGHLDHRDADPPRPRRPRRRVHRDARHRRTGDARAGRRSRRFHRRGVRRRDRGAPGCRRLRSHPPVRRCQLRTVPCQGQLRRVHDLLR